MAGVILDVQGKPATPAAGKGIFYPDSTSKRPSFVDDAGKSSALDDIVNASVAVQTPAVGDTYLVGSSILLQSLVPRIGTKYVCSFDVSKTAAGVATPIIIVRFGAAGSVADAAILTFTFPAQTAIADVGTFEVVCAFRSVGAAGTLIGRASLIHKGTATGLTGLSIEPGPTVVPAVSAGFNTALANAIIGLSITPGAAAAWTIQLVTAEVDNI